MTFQPNIPQATDNLDISQGDILENFQVLNSFLSVDHTPITGGTADDGKHISIHMEDQTSSIPSTTATEIALFNKNIGYGGIVGNVRSLMLRQISSGAQYPITGPVKLNSSGYTMVSGGIILQWGTTASITKNTITAIGFPMPFPHACFVVIPCTTDPTAGGTNQAHDLSISGTATPTQFNIYYTNGNSTAKFMWVAIGW